MHGSHFHVLSQNVEVRPAMQKPNAEVTPVFQIQHARVKLASQVQNAGSTPTFQKQDYGAYLHTGPMWQIPSNMMPSKQVQRTNPLPQGINSSKIRVGIQSIPKIYPSQPRTFENFGGGSVGCLKITIDSWFPIKHRWWKLQSDDFQKATIWGLSRRRLQSDDLHDNWWKLKFNSIHNQHRELQSDDSRIFK